MMNDAAIIKQITERLTSSRRSVTTSDDNDWGSFFASEEERDNESYILASGERVFETSEIDWNAWPNMAKCNRVSVDDNGEVVAYDVDE